MNTIETLEEQLNDFAEARRFEALVALRDEAGAGRVDVQPLGRAVNLHAHTFFSFNGYGWSPCRIAWEAFKAGLEVAGIVDFDVLDGMDETLRAGDILGMKTTVGLETRVFFSEYADAEINSPGEPGVYYFMGTGFVRGPEAGGPAADTLADMATRVRGRNEAMMLRVNDYLDAVRLDYDADVVPLTPSGNATERHLLEAYDRKARAAYPDPHECRAFWAQALGESDSVEGLMEDRPTFHEVIRKKLMRAGGPGYMKPEAGAFPALEDVLAMARACGALPTGTWLDGLSEGESDMRAQLALLIDKGVAALNVIPDRNWNIEDPNEKTLKLRKLHEVVEAAQGLHLPLVVGTELNKYGQKTVDDFDAPELAPFVDVFLEGARVIYGHTLMARYGDFGYMSPGSAEAFGDDRAAKNRFYCRVGALPALPKQVRDVLTELPAERCAKLLAGLASLLDASPSSVRFSDRIAAFDAEALDAVRIEADGAAVDEGGRAAVQEALRAFVT